MEQPPSRKVGSISDYDPMNDKYGSIIGQYGDGRGKGTLPGEDRARILLSLSDISYVPSA